MLSTEQLFRFGSEHLCLQANSGKALTRVKNIWSSFFKCHWFTAIHWTSNTRLPPDQVSSPLNKIQHLLLFVQLDTIWRRTSYVTLQKLLYVIHSYSMDSKLKAWGDWTHIGVKTKKDTSFSLISWSTYQQHATSMYTFWFVQCVVHEAAVT